MINLESFPYRVKIKNQTINLWCPKRNIPGNSWVTTIMLGMALPLTKKNKHYNNQQDCTQSLKKKVKKYNNHLVLQC